MVIDGLFDSFLIGVFVTSYLCIADVGHSSVNVVLLLLAARWVLGYQLGRILDWTLCSLHVCTQHTVPSTLEDYRVGFCASQSNSST